jgi:hypothetical protein
MQLAFKFNLYRYMLVSNQQMIQWLNGQVNEVGLYKVNPAGP